MSAWKAAGITYLQYTNICARSLRNSLKDDVRTIALRREQNNVRFAKWENGVQREQKLTSSKTN